MMRKAPLPANAQLLWYKLMNFDNRLHWEPWFSIDTDRLVSLGCLGSPKTTLAARDQLVKNGFLLHKRGVKGKPSQYSLQSVVEMEAGTGTDRPYAGGAGAMESYFGWTDDLKQDLNLYTTSIFQRFLPGKQVSNFDLQQVFEKIMDSREQEGTWIMEFPQQRKELLEYAFEQAAMAGSVNWRYINGIYSNFARRGIKTVGDIADNEL